jgi:LPS-assembly lipoprotein
LSSNPLKSVRLFALCSAALLPLCGCGFSPLYAQSGDTSVAQQLNTVNVANIPDRPGQLLRQDLETQLHIAGAPTTELYSLTVNYATSAIAVGEQEDTSYTEQRFNATAHWTLAPIGNPSHPLATGQAAIGNSANIIDQQYFALTLETDTINEQLANSIASQITTQVAAYFKSHPG